MNLFGQIYYLPDLPKTEDGKFDKKNIKAMIYQLRSKIKKQAKKTIV